MTSEPPVPGRSPRSTSPRAGAVEGGFRRSLHGWRATAASAGAVRWVYEVALAALLAATSAGTAFVSATSLPVLSAVVHGVAALMLTPLRLVFPVGALVAGSAVAAAAGEASTFLFVVLSASAGYRMRGTGRTAAGLLAAWCCWMVSTWRYVDVRSPSEAVVATAAFVLVSLVPAFVGWVVGRRRQMLRAMDWRNRQLHDQQAVVAMQARTRERTRIARDLHDSLGHQLTLISLYAGTLHSSSQQQRDEAVALLRTTAAAAMVELRQSIGVLRQQDEADDVGVAQPLTNLDSLAQAVRATGAPFTLTVTGTPRPLPPLIEHAAYRVVQEGVTNALRHARGAPVDVVLRFEQDIVAVEIVNGRGRPTGGPTGGQGLIGLTERLRLAGGVLHHGATPTGFRLAAMLPYHSPPVVDDSPAAEHVTSRADGDAVAELRRDAHGASGGEGDFAAVMRRSARRSKWGLIAAAGGIGAVVVVCCSAGIIVAAGPRMTVRSQEYHSVRIGQPETEVRRKLPAAEAEEADAVGGTEPPAGTECVMYRASLEAQLDSEFDGNLVYRFCFRDGALVHKEAFEDLTS